MGEPAPGDWGQGLLGGASVGRHPCCWHGISLGVSSQKCLHGSVTDYRRVKLRRLASLINPACIKCQ